MNKTQLLLLYTISIFYYFRYTIILVIINDVEMECWCKQNLKYVTLILEPVTEEGMFAKAGEIVRKLFSESKKNDLCYVVAKLLVKFLLLQIIYVKWKKPVTKVTIIL